MRFANPSSQRTFTAYSLPVLPAHYGAVLIKGDGALPRLFIPGSFLLFGEQRPLAVAALEDKVVQRATVEVLNCIYEEEFLEFSYGFRPGRGQHNALDALCVGITSRPSNACRSRMIVA
jgi:hypothetical protein